MLAKRQQVQASRRRPDEEIVRLFQIPYRPNFADADYERVQRRLANLYDLDELFGPFS
jgi:hypothetical protein